MSVKDRVDDAEFLWNHGRKEAAWVMALVAAAATARKRYPRPAFGDRLAFTKFVVDVLDTILYGTNPPRRLSPILLAGVPIEDIIYEHMRCNLIHEGELQSNVALSESRIVDGQLGAELRVGAVNEIPDFWVMHLLKAVRAAPENHGLFPPS